ncbi:hypothetical protein C8D99_11561 [Aminivibrio pyruvatiphilus]|uniref:Small ligand-binding sensory domain FIST n=1 Tax=Aminivibrio pyruvatiphilus TaxID=1005740 RepID=A0A4R8M519_9BACT|nr:FIST N-terminal domain-containing protein [Aminivibrio pyruvatiphilus]TDY58043.1 hypothetical protein C8D99_11561 [Aminivibrio pyruvatiphilus]
MLQAKVGWSTSGCARSAGEEAAKAAKVGGAKVALLYGSVDYDQEELLKGVGAVLGDVPVIGCTSYTGVLTPGGFITGPDGYCALMTLSDEEMTVGVGAAEKGCCAVSAGEEAALAALEAAGMDTAPDFFYMVAPPGEEEFYLEGIQSVIGRVPFFGGSAADNDLSGKWLVYGGGVVKNGVAVAFFWDKEFGNRYTGAYRPTGKRGIITKVENNRVLKEIDGKPALEVLAGWLGSTPADLQGFNLLGATIHHPLGITDYAGGHVWIRHPMAGNPDNSANIGNNLAEGVAVELMEATTDELIASVESAAKEAAGRLGTDVGALLAVHCGGRRGGIGDRMDETAAAMKKAIGDAPFIGVFTFGEYGYEGCSANGCGGLMLSFMALGK